MPLFGIEESGVTLIDCPGTHENNLLSAKAVTYTQMASIIIYVFRISTGISAQVAVGLGKFLINLGFRCKAHQNAKRAWTRYYLRVKHRTEG